MFLIPMPGIEKVNDERGKERTRLTREKKKPEVYRGARKKRKSGEIAPRGK